MGGEGEFICNKRGNPLVHTIPHVFLLLCPTTKQFLTEIDVLTRVKHANLVELFAFSIDGASKLTVSAMSTTTALCSVCAPRTSTHVSGAKRTALERTRHT